MEFYGALNTWCLEGIFEKEVIHRTALSHLNCLNTFYNDTKNAFFSGYPCWYVYLGECGYWWTAYFVQVPPSPYINYKNTEKYHTASNASCQFLKKYMYILQYKYYCCNKLLNIKCYNILFCNTINEYKLKKMSDVYMNTSLWIIQNSKTVVCFMLMHY